jgi:hypothetical protein
MFGEDHEIVVLPSSAVVLVELYFLDTHRICLQHKRCGNSRKCVFISLCRLFPFHKILAELICPGKVVHHYTDDSN